MWKIRLVVHLPGIVMLAATAVTATIASLATARPDFICCMGYPHNF